MDDVITEEREEKRVLIFNREDSAMLIYYPQKDRWEFWILGIMVGVMP